MRERLIIILSGLLLAVAMFAGAAADRAYLKTHQSSPVWQVKSESIPVPAVYSPEFFLAGLGPMVVHVRGVAWVIQATDMDDLYLNIAQLDGRTLCKTHVIMLRQHLVPAVQRSAVMHELLHASVCKPNGTPDNMYYNSTNAENHEGFSKFSDFETELLYENPELALYFAGIHQ